MASAAASARCALLYWVWRRDDTVYRNTRSLLLSRKNRWYFSGKFASGIGSPHWWAAARWLLRWATYARACAHQGTRWHEHGVATLAHHAGRLPLCSSTRLVVLSQSAGRE